MRRIRRRSSAPTFIICQGIEGSNYPFQRQYAEVGAWFAKDRPAAERAGKRGILLFLEHKTSEMPLKILSATSD